MACRTLIRQLVLNAGRRQRCTAAAQVTPEMCPMFGKRREPPPKEPAPVVPETPTDVDLGEPYHAIPAARGLPFFGTTLSILMYGGAAKMHEYIDMRHKKLGPIFREKLGPIEAVVLAQQDIIWEAYNQEGPFPMHMVPEPWLIYNRMRGIERGLFFMDGVQWHRKRAILNKTLLPLQEVVNYGPGITAIVDDLIKRWDALAHENGGVVPNLETELYNWSIETLGTIVFGRRLGCVAQPGQASEMQNFVYYVQKIFTESAKMSLFSPELAAEYRLPVWKRFEEAADNALRIARECTEQRIDELKNVPDLEKHGVIGQLLSNPQVTHDEIVNIVADLIIAAADTTSHATQWALYSLAKNPKTQEALLEKMSEVVPKEQPISYQHIDRITYLMWVVKETLRLYPIAPFLTRLFDKDVTIAGYNIPKKTLVLMSQYTLGRSPENFKNPNDFIPERWDRTNAKGHVNLAKGCMPFGSGPRSCIGKRIAEMKMRVLIGRTVQKYRLESEDDANIALRMITTPDRPIRLRLHKRDQ